VKTDGDLYCWGSDANGQLGNGPAPDVPTPALIMGNAKSVDAGEDHTCAVMQVGLRCWGKNFDGQLGTGDTTDREVPTEVGVPLKLGVEEVAAGDRHTCARKGNEAYCFGNDYNGACAANKWGPVVVPTLVAVPNVTHIAVGRERSGAVSEMAGLVRMWGVPPLGDAGGQPLGTPVEVKISGVSRIAGGYQHTCVLKVNGEVWCWGEDNDGQLGNGPELVNEPLPVPVVWGGPK
jgi:alpha-tubulin suppressor-like RCC1 family protein